MSNNIADLKLDSGLYEPKIHVLCVREELDLQHDILLDIRYRLKEQIMKLICEENLFKKLRERIINNKYSPNNITSFQEDVNVLIEHVRSDPTLGDELIKDENMLKNENLKSERGKKRGKRRGRKKKKNVTTPKKKPKKRGRKKGSKRKRPENNEYELDDDDVVIPSSKRRKSTRNKKKKIDEEEIPFLVNNQEACQQLQDILSQK